MNQREMEIMGATSIATEVRQETTVNRESDASVLRIEKTICSTYIFLDFFFLRFDRKLIDFSARRDRSRSVISSRFRSMDSIEGEKGKSRRRTNGFHIVTSKKKGTARIAARMDDAENRARTAYINSRLRGKSWPGPTPFFFLFSYPRPAVLYFLLHAKNSWLFTLSSLREPEKPTPPSSWDGGSPSSNRFLTHERATKAPRKPFY